MKSTADNTVLDKSQVVEDVNLYKWTDDLESFPEKLQRAIRLHNQLENLHGERMPKRLKNVHQRLKAYQEVSKVFREYSLIQMQLQKAAMRQTNQLKEGLNKRSGKRWTDSEDTALIELAASGNDVQQIGLALSRSPGAVSSRISHLVGIKRISVEFAGTIKGQLNGEEVEGTFVGEVRKTA